MKLQSILCNGVQSFQAHAFDKEDPLTREMYQSFAVEQALEAEALGFALDFLQDQDFEEVE